MIPEKKLDAVKNALRAAFEVSEFEDISIMTSGLSSALVFRIVVKGKPYLLRIITRTDEMGDPTNQFANMKAAAEAGIAPPIWYMSIEDRISITDFVEDRQFPISEAKTKLPELIRRMHSLPPFHKLMNYQSNIDGFLRNFQDSKMLPEIITEELFKQYNRIFAVYPRNDQDLVSCHNDLKPENILFDGEKVWLVDWEAAFLNDRYADIAIVANFVVNSDEEEAEYLRSYFGETVDDYRHARFFLARQILHMHYIAIFMLFGAKGKPVDVDIIKPKFRDFHNQIWDGEISLASDEAKIKYSLVHMEQFLHNTKAHRFEDALHIVSSSHRLM
ncbi:MAG TPA: phosphotransferase [Pseudobacteroides sp.]|uniref:phosphotransferase n=1 Tax=Pseudobacteroides sp. TaxID=1968840 RepID=UPI002F921366